MGKPAFRTNPETGRLEKLINGKYVPQNEMGAWKKGSPIRKFGRLLIREPSPEMLAKAKKIREKKDKEEQLKKESDRKKAVWTKGKRFTKAKDTSKRSPGSSQYTQQESKASKTGPLGGTNPYYKEKKKYGEDFKNTPKLKIGTKYEDGKPSADTTSSKSKSKSKKEAIMIGGKRATSIQKKLIAGGWTVKELEAKQKKHREWKKNRGK